MTNSPSSRLDLEEIITEGVHLDGMSEPVGSSGMTVTGGDDAIQYDDLASYPDGVRRIITSDGYTALPIIAEGVNLVGVLFGFLVRNGDWDKTKSFLERNPDGVRRKITLDGQTALHIAISRGHDHIANELMKLMQEEDFLLTDIAGQTALHYAVHIRAVKISRMLMEKMPQALGIQDMDGNTPLHLAVSSGSVEIVEYLVPLVQVEDLGIQNADGLTALHMASFYGQVNMVEILVKAMTIEDLGKQENSGRTALSFAVVIGNIDMVKCMVAKNQNLLCIKFQERIPLVSASATQHREMMKYLYTATPSEELRGIQGAMLLNTFILREMFDHALELYWSDRFPLQATALHLESQPLLVLAGMPSAFRSGTRLLFWQRWIYSWLVHLDDSDSLIRQVLCRVLKRTFKHIYLQKKMNEDALSLLRFICREIQTQNSRDNETIKKLFHKPLMEATRNGIYEIVHEIINSHRSLFFETDTDSRRMIDLAILHRQENIFNLIYGLHETSWAFFISHKDGDKNTMLHVAGMSPSNQLTRISGAALQMQRELQWFKEVESILDPLDRNAKNSRGYIAHELFTKNHMKLVEDGEKWMKAMASSCTAVAALIITIIITIMFAAAFTVPSGNNQDSGTPIFLEKKLFLTFIICDAMSFFTSSASVLMFIVILSARYSEEYFLEYLPRMMIIGLSSFFISIITMTIAFCAALFLMVRGQPVWVFVVIILLACVPVILFLLLLFPLLLEMFTSTYGSSIFKKKKKLSTFGLFMMGIKHATLQKSSTSEHAIKGAKMV